MNLVRKTKYNMVNTVTDPILKNSLDILGIPHDMNSLMERLPQSLVHNGIKYEFYIDMNENGNYEGSYNEGLYNLFYSCDYANIVDAIAYCVTQVEEMIRNNEITNIEY